MKKKLLMLLISGLPFGHALAQKGAVLPYKNAKLSTEERVKDLMSRMTLEEKVAQTLCHWESPKRTVFNDKGAFDAGLTSKFLPNGVGQIARPSEGNGSKHLNALETARLANVFQKHFVEKTRLGIPVMFHEESLHGNQAKDATCFPTHLALGSTWNEPLLTEIYTKIAEEVRIRGGHQVLAPVVDLGRDPRWGRTEETLGEDPYHVSRLAVAEVKAYQGGVSDKIDGKHVVSTLKHFGVHGMPEGGINIAPSFVDERTLREVYFPSFKACVTEANARSLMPCYNELSGIPAHANQWMLTDILRKEWGFKGVIVSDYTALNDLINFHKVAKDPQEAAKLALMAGVDIETPNLYAFSGLGDLIKSGQVPASALDDAVARILTTKFDLGLFEQPYTNPEEAQRIVGNEENRKLSLKSAQEAMVLLKNENNLLPLPAGKYKKIALIGPNADRCILGGYSDEPKQKITPLQALRTKAKGQFEVVYSEGCRLTDKGDWFVESAEVKVTDPAENRKRIQEAVQVAKDADVIILFVGSNEAIYREGWSLTHLGDQPDIDLFGQQNELVKAMKTLGKPMAGFVFSGPPLACQTLNESVSSLVQCWYLGQETGNAVADLILGNINPSGKLPITIPRSVGHIPAYYNYKPSARRGFHLADISPLYPFGHGLSYTSFKYENLKVSSNQVHKGESVTVTVEVSNTGKMAGAEVVQLYIRDILSSVTRPVKELKDFTKITLAPGEKKTVTLSITPEKLAFYDRNMKFFVEPGEFEVYVGTSSVDNQKITFSVIE